MENDEKKFFHMFSNGNDAKYLIQNYGDYAATFNRFGVCAAFNQNVHVLSFSIEDNHVHSILHGFNKDCIAFSRDFELRTNQYCGIFHKDDPIDFHCDLYQIDDDNYLKNACAYSITQPTKDGKKIMPYDYLWGTGSLYFRDSRLPSIWTISESGYECKQLKVRELPKRIIQKILHTHKNMPDEWIICNGLLLPQNYIDIQKFESVFVTHNSFRVFMCGSKNQDQAIIEKMASSSGIWLEDAEARKICDEICLNLYNVTNIRQLPPAKRLSVANEMRKYYHISSRQLALVVKLPESEIRKYF